MSSDISFNVTSEASPSKGEAELPPFLTSVRNREESEPQAPQPISRRRMRRGRVTKRKYGCLVAIGSRTRPSYPIWGRGFGWALLLLVVVYALIKVVDLRDQSLPQLPYSSAPAQVR